ncbi:Auxin response factor, partial [Cynara cardunculus var. scolymus]
MTSSEVSSKGNSSMRGDRDTFSLSGFSDKNDAVGDSRTVPAVSGAVDADVALYKELWRACAGPLVTVPRENELVFYFPQGHIEQVEASTHQVPEQQMPVYDLPSKILCRVVNVQLKAEQETDEVFAQITLMPEPDVSLPLLPMNPQDVNSVKKEPAPPAQSRFHVHSFCKTLTASDTSTHGGFSVLRRHADECLPPLVRHVKATSNTGAGSEGFAWKRMALQAHISGTSPAEFIVPYDQYMESIKNNYSIGMRFKMRFEGEEAPEQRFTGTVVGIEESDPKRWPESKWRCLKARDGRSSAFGEYSVHLNRRGSEQQHGKWMMPPPLPSYLHMPSHSTEVMPKSPLSHQNEVRKPQDGNCKIFGVPLAGNKVASDEAGNSHQGLQSQSYPTLESDQRFEQSKSPKVI